MQPLAMPKYTQPLPLDEYDKLSLEEKAAYISDMVDLLRVPQEPPAPGNPNLLDDKPKGDPPANDKPLGDPPPDNKPKSP